MPTPTPLSDPTEIREFVIKGDVITQGKGTGLGGVDVSITTKIPTPDGQEEDVKFDTKSSQSGYFTLKFKIQVIPKTRKVLTDWYFDEQKDLVSTLQGFNWGWQAGLGLDIAKFVIDIKYEGNFQRVGNNIIIDGNTYDFNGRANRFIVTFGYAF